MSVKPKCRTCADDSTKLYTIDNKLGKYDKSIRDLILVLIPELDGQLYNTDAVCSACRKLLHQCLQFIEKSFKVNADYLVQQLNAEQHSIEENTEETSHNYVSRTTQHNTEKMIPKADCNDADEDICPRVYTDDDYTDVEYLVGQKDQLTKIDYNTILVCTTANSAQEIKELNQFTTNKIKRLQHSTESNQEVAIENSHTVNKAHTRPELSTYPHVQHYSYSNATIEDKENKLISEEHAYGKHDFSKNLLTGNGLNGISNSNVDSNESNRCKYSKSKDIDTNAIKKDHLSFKMLSSPPNKRILSHDRIVRTLLPQKNPEKFIASLAAMKVNIFGCSLKSEPSLQDKRVLLIGDLNNMEMEVCDECGKELPKHGILMRIHKKKHIQMKTMSEEKKQFMEKRKQERDQAKLKRMINNFHKKEAYKHDATTYMCENCGKILRNRVTYHFHKLTHSTRRKYVCHICGGTVKSTTSLRIHIASVHGERNHPCSLCPKVFKAKFHMKRHIKVTHMKVGRVQCPECGKSCMSNSVLQKHRSLVHLKEVKVTCPVCGVGLYRKDYLKRHLRTHLKDEQRNGHVSSVRDRNYWKEAVPCKVCGKIVVRGCMSYHLKLHRAVRKYGCKTCGFTFKVKKNLLRHEKTHEKDEGSYKCLVCWKYFQNQSELDHHMTRHTKTYNCPLCSEGFGRKFVLKDHINNKHPDEAASIVDTVEPLYPYSKKFRKEHHVTTRKRRRKVVKKKRVVEIEEGELPCGEREVNVIGDECSQDTQYTEEGKVEGYDRCQEIEHLESTTMGSEEWTLEDIQENTVLVAKQGNAEASDGEESYYIIENAEGIFEEEEFGTDILEEGEVVPNQCDGKMEVL